jgi:hypothetical protein
MSFRCTGREIPSFFILAIKVVRFSPSRAAAPLGPPIAQLTDCSVRRIRARWESLNKPWDVGISVTGLLSEIGKKFGSTPSFDRITARSIRFWSSRTFPGQEYEVNAASVSSDI